MPEAQRPPSPEALEDLKALARDHGVNAELIKSLTASKAEARAHLRFSKRIMFLSNGAVMTIGLVIAGFGGRTLLDGFSVLGVMCLVVGGLLFVKFMSVFASMTLAIKATEVVARKHDLI